MAAASAHSSETLLQHGPDEVLEIKAPRPF